MNQYISLRSVVRLASLVVVVVTCFTQAWSQTFKGVLTQHNDNARTGQNLNETILTPQNVDSKTFGKVFSYSVDGQIYSQPLYVPSVTIPGKGKHNVVYVETQNDSVYGFDADGLSSTPLLRISFINRAQGITPVPCGTDGNTDISCGVYPIYGINSTPVIDPGSKTMYVLVRTAENGSYFQRLHAIDITTGAEKFGGPVTVTATVHGTGAENNHGIITFNPLADVQRAGLLLVNGRIYIGWAGAAHGWILAYNAKTLKRVGIFNSTPDARVGGVWASGNGLAADASGNIYAAIGDALFDASTGGRDYGDSLMKFNGSLSVLDYFTPMDQACRKDNDMDLGSGGPILLPTQSGSVPNELVIAGKGGNPCDSSGVSNIYLLSRDDLGKYNVSQDNAVEEVLGAPFGYWSSPAYWEGESGANLYLGGVTSEGGKGDNLKMYSVTNGLLSTVPVAQSAHIFPVGTTPSVSANGTNDGIVWAVERQDSLGTQPGDRPAVLYAYDATNLTVSLYNSAQALSQGVPRDRGGCGNKYAVPTIANGRVYVGTQNELDVFGLLGSSSGPNIYLSNDCYSFPPSTLGVQVRKSIGLTNNGTSTLTVSKIAMTGTNAADFSQTNTCASLAVGAKCNITVTFTASVAKPETAYVTITDNAVGSPHNIYMIGVGKN
jgi:hypothetical protein